MVVMLLFLMQLRLLLLMILQLGAPSPSYQQLCQNAIIQDISIVASNGAGSTYTYQWYENTVNNNTGGTPIPGATSIGYTPQEYYCRYYFYYYCVTQPASGCECIGYGRSGYSTGSYLYYSASGCDQACVGLLSLPLVYLILTVVVVHSISGMRIQLITILLVLLFQEQLVVVIRLVQLLLVLPIITVLLIYHRVDVILFIPIQPRLLFI